MGVVGPADRVVMDPGRVTNSYGSRSRLESDTIHGDSPVGESVRALGRHLSTTGHEKPCGKLGRPLPKAKYVWRPIVN